MLLVQNKPTKSQFTSFIDRIYKKDGKSKQTENRIFSKRLIGECVCGTGEHNEEMSVIKAVIQLQKSSHSSTQ